MIYLIMQDQRWETRRNIWRNLKALMMHILPWKVLLLTNSSTTKSLKLLWERWQSYYATSATVAGMLTNALYANVTAKISDHVVKLGLVIVSLVVLVGRFGAKVCDDNSGINVLGTKHTGYLGVFTGKWEYFTFLRLLSYLQFRA